MVHHLVGLLVVTPRSHLLHVCRSGTFFGFHLFPCRTRHHLSVLGSNACESSWYWQEASCQSDCGGGQCALHHHEWVRVPGNVGWRGPARVGGCVLCGPGSEHRACHRYQIRVGIQRRDLAQHTPTLVFIQAAKPALCGFLFQGCNMFAVAPEKRSLYLTYQ